MPKLSLSTTKLAVIGLGYVGLPLAVEFGKYRRVIGYDIDVKRIDALQAGIDSTQEVDCYEMLQANALTFSSVLADISGCNTFIVTVPTPIDEQKCPNLEPLIDASRAVGEVLKGNDVVIYESTVYPGVTEEVCVPVLEKISGLTFNVDFFVGYSPERINPGDRTRHISEIIKITSGSNAEVADFVDELYASIITAGTHKSPSIRIAEAAKVIENTQRDLNIALINELAIIFNRMGIETEAVLEAAGTKWNFLPFRPGLVGGHCISVDPYYLTYKSEAIGYQPQIILAGRRLNDNMGRYVATQLVKAMARKSIRVQGARVLVMGLTFKENCPDIRNTRVVDLIVELEDHGVKIDVYDPWVDVDEAEARLGVSVIRRLKTNAYDGIILAVAHREFAAMGSAEIRNLGRESHILYDLKYILDRDQSDLRL